MFNALRYIKVLESVGFGREQAEAQVQLVMAAIEEEVASKSDMAEVRADFAELKSDLKSDFAKLRSEFAEVKLELKSDFANLRSEFADLRSEFARLRSEFAGFKSEIVFKLGALMVGCATVGFGALGILVTLK